MGKLFGISKDGKPPKNNKQQKFITQDNGNMNEGYYNQGMINNQNNMNSQYYQNSETFVYNSIPSDNFNNQGMYNNQGTYDGGTYNDNNMMSYQGTDNNQMMNNYNNMNQQYYDGNNGYNMQNQQFVNQNQSDYNQSFVQMPYGDSNNQNLNMPPLVSDDEKMIPKSVQPPKENMVELPSVVEDKEEYSEVLGEELEEVEDTEAEVFDPLNNANNPIPVNPVAPKDDYVEEELPGDVKANLFSVGGMMLGMIFSPGTTIIKNSKKYRSIIKALSVVLWVTVISIILAMATRIIVGSFNTSYNSVSGFSQVYFDMTNIFNIDNYVPYFIIALIMTLGAITIASLIYYASSFLNSKGVHIGTYFMISSLAMVPIIIGVLVLYQIASIVSVYIGLLFVIFTFVYTLISFYIGMNEVLTFDNVNKRILYNSINLSIIFLIIIVIFVVCFKLNVLTPPTLYF